jgi:protein TonB
MGKIVKYCNSCDEGFAAKFTFCPNCGQGLEAFEMNPLEAAAEAARVPEAPAFIEPVEETVEAAPVEEVTPEIVDEPTIEAAPEPEVSEVDEPEVETVTKPAPVFVPNTPLYADAFPRSLEAEHEKALAEGGFYVTVIEEKNVKQRNSLLLGTFGFMIFAVIFGLAYSIFSRPLDVGSIDEGNFTALLLDDVPMPVDDEEQHKKDKDAGGGGGGGREEEETTKGDLANQTQHPERPPQAIPRMTNPDVLLQPASTQGNKTFPQVNDRYGDPNGRFSNWNNGPGSGGGQGTGTGTGQGSGRGTGAGSGIGSGYGSGIGSGNGGGTGSGDGDSGPPPVRVGVTSGIKILSKPRPGYTDSARQANIQGTVILRVTFLANGSVGGISAVKGLPNGLTEQAIAAARRISFTPAMSNGQPQNVTKQIEYTFSIY